MNRPAHGLVVERRHGEAAGRIEPPTGPGPVADVALGRVGVVVGIEVSRLARSNADWYNLMDLCSLTDTLIADSDGVYHPGDYNSRLVLGLSVTEIGLSLTSTTRV